MYIVGRLVACDVLIITSFFFLVVQSHFVPAASEEGWQVGMQVPRAAHTTPTKKPSYIRRD
ncbi:hypothetical protein EJ06DRAFT_530332 [Trichodelitschia bisporula]|uniref:Uncharacterized protein n=1 Tax=Trichodelitschia bisporula TaxID=703511 RepID=A0A6G1HWA9_9PEZI|nr:hypothetical protein EJ06DRAFT_530332 [Trichodelitschia bisporula]